MFYEFEFDHNAAAEAMKNTDCVKGEDAVDFISVTRWFKKFRSGCKNRDDQAKTDRSKMMDSEAVLQITEANPVTSILRVSSELDI